MWRPESQKIFQGLAEMCAAAVKLFTKKAEGKKMNFIGFRNMLKKKNHKQKLIYLRMFENFDTPSSSPIFNGIYTEWKDPALMKISQNYVILLRDKFSQN